MENQTLCVGVSIKLHNNPTFRPGIDPDQRLSEPSSNCPALRGGSPRPTFMPLKLTAWRESDPYMRTLPILDKAVQIRAFIRVRRRELARFRRQRRRGASHAARGKTRYARAAPTCSGNVGRIDVVLIFFRLVTVKTFPPSQSWKPQPPVDAYFFESFTMMAKPLRAPST